MARYSYQGFATDGTGRVIEEATVTVYDAGTTTGSTIYTVASGGTADSDSAVSSNSSGYFQFFIDSGDYSTGQGFDIVISKTNYNSTTMEDVTIF
jgi:hypothetical protein